MSANIKAVNDKVIGRMVNPPSGHKTLASGIIIKDKDMDVSGIGPRWFEVHSVGPEAPSFVKAGDFVLVEHGRWSNKLTVGLDDYIWLLDNEKILMIAEGNPLGCEDQWTIVDNSN